MKRIVILAALLACLLGASFAHAAQAPLSSISFDGFATGSSSDDFKSISLQQFDTKLGTLQSVSLWINDQINYSITGTNEAVKKATAATFNYVLTYDLATSLNTNDLLTHNFNEVISGGTVTPGGSYTVQGTSTKDTTLQYSTNLSPYIGNAFFNLIVTPVSDLAKSISGGKITEVAYTDTFRTDAKVTYSYTATPIPGAVWLLGSGLVGMIGLRRKLFG
jgi:hypothetical protein